MPRKKATRFPGVIILKIFLALGITLVGMYYLVQYLYPPAFVKYDGFGIRLPSKFSVHGIDISRYQRNINWDQVKTMEDKGIVLQFAYIKATEGVYSIDPFFRRNWVKAKQAGVSRGAYHFFTANRTGASQAKNFTQTVTLLPGDLPPVLDIEKSYGRSKEVIQKEVLTWLQIIEATYKVRPIIYTNPSFYNAYLAGVADDYPLWIAHYYAEVAPRINRNWLMWQHNEKGRVDGILSAVDFNVFNGSFGDFEDLKIVNNE